MACFCYWNKTLAISIYVVFLVKNLSLSRVVTVPFVALLFAAVMYGVPACANRPCKFVNHPEFPE